MTRSLVTQSTRPGRRRALRRFGRSEEGSSTIQFVLMLPLFFTFFLSAFELGMLLTRQMMLDRAVDLTVRQVRLGGFSTTDPAAMHDALKAMICANISVMPDCDDNLLLEMLPVDPRAWVALPADVDCVDRDDDSVVQGNPYVPGLPNEMVILRACALYDPYFPTNGLGAAIPRETGTSYALISSSAYVVEPD